MSAIGWQQLLPDASPLSRRGPLSHRRLLRVHAAAATRLETLRSGTARSAAVRPRRSVGLARHRIRGGQRIAARVWNRSPGNRRQHLPHAARAIPATASRGAARRQCVLAAGVGRARRQTHARALRRSAAAGPVAHPGRQGPRALDAVRRQRTGTRQGVLEELLHRSRHAGPDDQGPAFIADLLRTVYREQPQTADDLHRAGFRILPQRWQSAPLPFWDEGCPRGRSRLCSDEQAPARWRQVSAHLPAVRPAAGAAAASVSQGRTAPAAVSRQPRVLGRAALSPAASSSCRSACKYRCS